MLGEPPTLYPCSDPDCDDCIADVSVCQQCTAASSKKLRRLDNRCYPSPGTGFGLNTSDTRYVEPCKLTSCIDCQADYSYCTKTSSGKREMLILEAVFDPQKLEIVLKFDSELLPTSFLDLLSFTFTDDLGRIIPGVAISRAALNTLDNSSIVFTLKVTGSLSDLSLEISHTNPNQPAFVSTTSEFPTSQKIRMNEITTSSFIKKKETPISNATGIHISAATRGIGLGTTLTTSSMAGMMAVASPTTNLVSSVTGSAGVSSLLKLISALDYLIMTNGNRTELSDAFINLFRNDPWEFVGNPFVFAEAEINCTPSENFEENEISCNLMNNYGSDLLTYLAVLMAVVVLWFFNSLVALIQKKYKRIAKIGEIILFLPNSILNVDLFVSMVDGAQMEITRWATLNIATSNTSIGQVAGTGTSILLLVFYVGYLVLVSCQC